MSERSATTPSALRISTSPALSARVIAHRGASGYRPEHTLAAYALAIRQGAEIIEPDVVMTRDGVPVVRHENEISSTTDVAAHPEFAARRTTRTVDASTMTGWFTEDFTLAELRTLRATERLPQLRPDHCAYDGRYLVPTLAEVFALARSARTVTGQPVAVAPETKHPSYFASIGLPVETALVETLNEARLNHRDAPVIIQSFETANLEALRRLTDVPLVQLIDSTGAPWDLQSTGDPRTYADLVTPAGLRRIAGYADAVGYAKDVMIPRTGQDTLGRPTRAVADAHRAGLRVIGWTFRRENAFLPADHRRGSHPEAPGDLAAEIATFLAVGMDGFFTDHPDIGFRAAFAARVGFAPRPTLVGAPMARRHLCGIDDLGSVRGWATPHRLCLDTATRRMPPWSFGAGQHG